MYRRSIAVFLCPVYCIMTRSLTPAIAAAVTSDSLSFAPGDPYVKPF